ncbi:MAG: glycosyltransferase family 2 protein [Acetobacteraceae bacterium]
MAPMRVSVLMTTYNGASTIGESIASVLAQSFEDFELVVVDDASTDATPSLLAATPDPRIRILRNARNLGVVGARNAGFAVCCGAYVAALDHDDLAERTRLERQVALLDREPRVVLAGTWIRELLPAGRVITTDYGSDNTPAVMRWQLHLRNPYTYSSIMVRADAVRSLGAFMREDAIYADDYDLYLRLARVGELAMVPEVLCAYRTHRTNITHTVTPMMDTNAAAVLAEANAPFLGADADDAARLFVRYLTRGSPPPDAATLRRLGRYLQRLLAGFIDTYRPTAAEAARIREFTGQIWWHCVRAGMRNGRPWLVAEHFRARRLRAGFHPSFADAGSSLAIGLLRAPTSLSARAFASRA